MLTVESLLIYCHRVPRFASMPVDHYERQRVGALHRHLGSPSSTELL